MLPMVLLTVGLSLILSLVQGIVRDTAQMVLLLTTFLLFMTPVLYGIPQTNRVWFQLNPLTALVNGPRDMLVCGKLCDPEAFVISSIFALLVFLMSWRVFHLVETKIPERI
jgi:lipopolysaccharide transport system permease protein